MKRVYLSVMTAALVAAAAIPAAAQTRDPLQVIKPVTGLQTALGISYPEGVGIKVDLAGTERLPGAKGVAEVERRRGETDVNIKLENVKPATMFGGDISTYVLWIVSPEGHLDNAGEFIVRGDDALLKVSTPLQTFGMFVTAEPHYLVDTPSTLIVLQNVRPRRDITGQLITGAEIRYRGYDGVYNAMRESLAQAPATDEEVRTDMKQARVAVELAQRAGAEEYAPEKLAAAQEKLESMIAAVEARIPEQQAMVLGHEVVRLAVEAEQLAEERAFQAALNAEREEHAAAITDLEKNIAAAETEAERARLETQQREMLLQMEREARATAAREAEEEARRAAEAERAAEMARLDAERSAAARIEAEAQARLARERALEADRERQRAQEEREAAMQRMQEALSVVVETRRTATGLVVNLPDILFDFDKATLRPEARETLAKVCGIMLVAPVEALGVEGHTDSVGSDDYNQSLSEKRAQTVATYLAECGLRSAFDVKGLGESNPIASNDTNDGRQKNRRVEIIIDSAALESVGALPPPQ